MAEPPTGGCMCGKVRFEIDRGEDDERARLSSDGPH